MKVHHILACCVIHIGGAFVINDPCRLSGGRCSKVSTDDGSAVRPLLTAPIDQVDLETGHVIQSFASVSEAVRSVEGASNSGISHVIHDRQKSCGGFFWRRRPSDDRVMSIDQNSHRRIPVEQVDVNTGKVLATYASCAEATKAVGGSGSEAVHRVVTGRRKAYKGFFWRKVGDHTEPTPPTKPYYIRGRQRVEQICLETNTTIATYDSIADTALALNLKSHMIRRVLSGEQHSTGGFKFRTVGKPEPFKRPVKAIAVQQICLETGDVLATYPSHLQASKAVNVSGASISSASRGTNSKTCRGYAWRRVQEVD